MDDHADTTDVPQWRSDRRLCAASVRAAIVQQFPDLKVTSVDLCAEGWDFEVYLINGALIFRFPKRRSVQLRLLAEIQTISQIAPALPAATPDYAWIGSPSEHFPYVFAGYTRLSGLPLDRADLQSPVPESLCRDIGIFLTALHCLPLCNAALDVRASADAIQHLHDVAVQQLPHAEHALSRELFASCKTFLRSPASHPPPRPHSCTVVHGDLDLAHILTCDQRQRLLAVIDWTDVSISDPTLDFLWLWISFGPAFVRHLISFYAAPVDGIFLDRIQALGICKAIAECAFGLQTQDAFKSRRALRALARALGTRPDSVA